MHPKFDSGGALLFEMKGATPREKHRLKSIVVSKDIAREQRDQSLPHPHNGIGIEEEVTSKVRIAVAYTHLTLPTSYQV